MVWPRVSDPDQVYDVETFPNVFTMCSIGLREDVGRFFEISERRNDAAALFAFLTQLKRMFGFNNFHFDWPILDHFLTLMEHGHPVTAWDLYQKAQRIIDESQFGKPGPHTIWQPKIPQVDIFKIHHFDNPAKATSLKAIEFAMRSERVMDLPFPVGVPLRSDQIDTLLNYNGHDVLETKKFIHISWPMIEFRESLGPEWMNRSDASIGEHIFIEKLEAAGVRCFHRVNGRKTPRQTQRGPIPLASVVFPEISFDRPELRALHLDILNTTVVNTKGEAKWKVELDGIPIDIGTGGIHGSIKREHIHGDNILDIDVGGYYPAIAIQYRVYPEHLGPVFCDVYADLKAERDKLPKSNPRSGALKLANNAVYGKSNNNYSCFKDAAYMLKITMNGQLLQLTFAEAALRIPGVRIIQMNTDGMTFQYPDSAKYDMEWLYWDWQRRTRLGLEHGLYSNMWIRDVNNYLARSPDGKMKRKGDYDYEKRSGSIGGQIAYERDFSQLVVPRAVEAALVHDIDLADYIINHEDPWDFLMRVKIGRGATVDHGGENHTGVLRYYVSTGGHQMIKTMNGRRSVIHAEGQATAIGERKNYQCSICAERFGTKGMFEIHNRDVHSWRTRIVNVFDGRMPSDIDHRYYLNEAEKLIV